MDEDIVNGVKTAVGYHNYYNIGVYDAVAKVAKRLGEAGLRGGWHATSLQQNDPLPENAVRVGQIRVRQGDPEFQLIILRKKEVADG
jgi:hypothetical protein